MSAFDKLQRWSFDGITFPGERWTNIGGLRDHVHEYWKTDGGDPEKGGRKLYEFEVLGNFQDRFKAYVGLFPDALDRLIRTFEIGKTADLVVPFRGTFQCYAIAWTEQVEAKIRSGEKVLMRFRQDNGNLNALIELTDTSQTSIATGASALAAKLDQVELSTQDANLFSQIQAMAASVLAVKDTADLYGQLVGAKVSQLTSLITQADTLTSMQDPSNNDIVEALHALWAATVQFGQDVQNKRTQLQTWITSQLQSIQQVSVAIYGNTSKVDELLSINSGAFPDPYRIQAGTPLLYYPTT